jgi:2-oxoglutarate dehydrogenase E2 component (dihydrolipoamide succinyltransferase)
MIGEILELTPMRRAIADHMVRSKATSPHVTTVHEVDMSAVVTAREVLKAQYAERGVNLTYTAFIIHAAAQALAEHPMVNSSWTDEGIKLHRDVNIGMAVAIPQGLIVPVLRNADQKSLMGVARDIGDLATRARNKQLLPDDVQGGTFTLTNYGTLGSLFGTPVINQPQVAILGTGAIVKRVVVAEGPGGDSIAIRPMMFLALTFDHRVLDGGMADPFLRSIVERLQNYQA